MAKKKSDPKVLYLLKDRIQLIHTTKGAIQVIYLGVNVPIVGFNSSNP